ncbi:MAG: hypothetical protein ABIF87_03305 [Pseudomonadota bacterium]
MASQSGSATFAEIMDQKGISMKNSQDKGVKQAKTTAPTKFNFMNKPPVPKVGTTVLTEEQRQANLRELEAFRSEVAASILDCVTGLRAIERMTEQEASIYKEDTAARKQAIKQMLDYDEPYCSVTVLAFADALVRTCNLSRGAVLDTIHRMVDTGFLTDKNVPQDLKRVPRNGTGIRIYSVNYAVTESYVRHYEKDAKEILVALEKLIEATVKAGRDHFQEAREHLREMNTDPMPLADLVALVQGGQPAKASGTLILRLPDREVKDRETNQPKILKGGDILVEVETDGRIFFREAIGGPQRIVRELAETETFVWATQLAQESFQPSKRLEEDVFKRAALLHRMLRSAIAETEKFEERRVAFANIKAQAEAERKELESRVTLTAEEFLLEDKVGSFLLEYCEPWNVRGRDGQPDQKIQFVMGLVTRYENGKIGVECPDRLKSFFGGAQEPAQPRERFEGIVYPLGTLLRIVWSSINYQTRKKQRVSKTSTVQI